MTEVIIDPRAFRDFEVAGWEAKADDYHRFFEPITPPAASLSRYLTLPGFVWAQETSLDGR
jgi:hypothetical protein